jgi:RND family efflux transporter MFP subunit
MKFNLSAGLQRVVRHWKGRQRLGWSLSTLAVLAVVAWFLLRPGQTKANVSANTDPPALPSVVVARVDRQDLYNEVTIPAEFRPFAEVELHAKVSGYLQQISVDFGDQVKAGQLLAKLEIPELQDQLNSAVATKQKAEADYKNAHLTYTRLVTVNQGHPNLVAQQDLDTAEAKDSTAAAEIAATTAEVEKYQTMVAYTKITAPFDGVITRRYADPGALIQAGTASDTQSRPLVRVSDNYRLRLDFPVSVDRVKDIRLGDTGEVRVESLGSKMFMGTISRFTQKVDEDTRTMITEMEVDNHKLELVPGMYATVVLKMERHPQALAIPIEAIASGGKTIVDVVNSNHEIEERAVTLGLETPTKYEVLSGLKEGELVIVGNPGQIKAGEKVEAKLVPVFAAQ